jgi:DNA-binding transcriptional LysR family regulator
MDRRDADRAKAPSPELMHFTIGPAIELRHLRYFLMVSEELHFRRAAERLYMAQPPLSQAIRKLEDELGVQLLTRTSRAVALTEAGSVFAEEARKVLARFDSAVAETRRAGGGSSSLQIGCTPYLPIDLLHRYFDGLHEREPRVQPQVAYLVAAEQITRLQSGALDLGIFPFPSTVTVPELEMQPLFPGERLSAFLRPDHRLADNPVLGPDDLADETLVTFDQATIPPLATWFRQELARAGYRFSGEYEIGTDTRDRILAAAEGRGIALLPGSISVIPDSGSIVVRRPLDPPITMPDTVVAWHTRPPAQLRALIEEIRELARALRATAS